MVSPRRILVTGGAGYIGAHTVRLLLKRGYRVTVVDDLSRGYRHNVESPDFHELQVQQTGALADLLAGHDAVIHFAAYISVGESMQAPELYFANNTAGSLSLFTAMLQAGVKHLVFSSTAAVYGIPHTSPILESFPIAPVNPYGESKVMVETLLKWFDLIHGLRSVCLRYFNASGADPDGGLGEEHDPETHLIPLMLRAAATGRPLTVFGDDYDTPDGTCIRDYIHVNDLADAHIRAVEALLAGAPSDQFNEQALHILRHLCSAFTRPSWLLEYRRHMLALYDERHFWDEVKNNSLAHPDTPVAIGLATLLSTRLFGGSAPTQLNEWTLDRLPDGVRLWAEHYGSKAVLADAPGTKLHLLLEDELTSSGRSWQKKRRSLLPLRCETRVARPSPNASLRKRLRLNYYQARFILFRLRFHVIEGLRYGIEAWRWKQQLVAHQVCKRLVTAKTQPSESNGS